MNYFVGAAAASATGIPVDALASIPQSVPKLALDGSQCGPELRAAYCVLDAANDVLKGTSESFSRVWKLHGEWEKANRPPQNRRAYKKWSRRYDSHLEEIDYDAIFDAHTKARNEFKKAQIALAKVKVCRTVPQGLHDLRVRGLHPTASP